MRLVKTYNTQFRCFHMLEANGRRYVPTQRGLRARRPTEARLRISNPFDARMQFAVGDSTRVSLPGTDVPPSSTAARDRCSFLDDASACPAQLDGDCLAEAPTSAHAAAPFVDLDGARFLSCLRRGIGSLDSFLSMLLFPGSTWITRGRYSRLRTRSTGWNTRE